MIKTNEYIVNESDPSLTNLFVSTKGGLKYKITMNTEIAEQVRRMDYRWYYNGKDQVYSPDRGTTVYLSRLIAIELMPENARYKGLKTMVKTKNADNYDLRTDNLEVLVVGEKRGRK